MIRIHRTDSAMDQNITYEIYLNGMKLDTIQVGETKRYDLKNGDYELQIKSYEMHSNKLKFNVYDGQILEFTCYPLYENYNKSFYKIVKGGQGIFLENNQNLYL